MIGGSQLGYFYPVEDVACLQVAERITGKLYKDDPLVIPLLGDSFLRMYQTHEPRTARFIADQARELGASGRFHRERWWRIRHWSEKRTHAKASTSCQQEGCDWEFVERDLKIRN